MAPGEAWYFLVDVIAKKGIAGKYFSIEFTNPNNTAEVDTLTIRTEIGNLLDVRNEKNIKTKLSIGPNPSTEKVTLSFVADINMEYSISVINIIGEKKFEKTLDKQEGDFSTEVDVSSFQSGIYFVILSNGASSETRKLIVK